MSYLPLNRTWYNLVNGDSCLQLYVVEKIESHEEIIQIREFEKGLRKNRLFELRDMRSGCRLCVYKY